MELTHKPTMKARTKSKTFTTFKVRKGSEMESSVKREGSHVMVGSRGKQLSRDFVSSHLVKKKLES